MMKKEYYTAPVATLVLLTSDLLMASDEKDDNSNSWVGDGAEITLPLIPLP